MKTRNIITAIGAITLTAMVVNLNAAERLLSPRAKDNQIAVAPGAASGLDLATVNRDRIGSPRALGNEITPGSIQVASAPATKCAVVGTPRQEGMFASCCKVMPANCRAIVATCCAK